MANATTIYQTSRWVISISPMGITLNSKSKTNFSFWASRIVLVQNVAPASQFYLICIKILWIRSILFKPRRRKAFQFKLPELIFKRSSISQARKTSPRVSCQRYLFILMELFILMRIVRLMRSSCCILLIGCCIQWCRWSAKMRSQHFSIMMQSISKKHDSWDQMLLNLEKHMTRKSTKHVLLCLFTTKEITMKNSILSNWLDEAPPIELI